MGSTVRGRQSHANLNSIPTPLRQLATALKLKSVTEWHRSQNIWGLLEWQLNEGAHESGKTKAIGPLAHSPQLSVRLPRAVWPTYGWGSIEYSGPPGYPGAVLGGRWKPAHHFLAAALADVFVACGADSRCCVKNDSPLQASKLRRSVLKSGATLCASPPLQGFTGSATFSLVHLATGAESLVSRAPSGPWHG